MCCSQLLYTNSLLASFRPQIQQTILLVSMMEWYSVSDVEDSAVPRNEEVLDQLPSLDNLSSWGKIVRNFNSSRKSPVKGVEELYSNENMFSSEVEQLTPSVSGGSYHAFRQQSAYPDENSDNQLNDLNAFDDADDIFFRSIFEADGNTMEEAERSANFMRTSSKDDVMSMVDLLGEENILDCTNDDEHICHSPRLKNDDSEEYSNVFEDISEDDIPMEESALVELQRLTVQLAKKTRICFRDSLYRLAENSRDQIKSSQNGNEDLENRQHTTSSGPSRFRKSKAKKSETNAIDRTVASLLFNTSECCNFTAEETAEGEYQDNSDPYQPNSSISSHCTVPEGDAEVPTFGLSNQLLSPSKGHTHFSSASLTWS